MRLAVLAPLLLAAACTSRAAGVAVDAAPPPDAQRLARHPGTFLVASYNVNYGNDTLDEAATQLETVDADLVCMQESTDVIEAAFRRRLGHLYPGMYFRTTDGPWLASGFGCMAKAPLTVEYVPKSDGLFGFLVVHTTLGGRPAAVLVLHLMPPRLDANAGLTDLPAAMEAMEDTHALELPGVRARLETGTPTLVLGDLNSTPSMLVPTDLRRDLVDSWASAHPGDTDHPTWEWPTRLGLTIRRRLDYIFHSSHFKTTAAWVLEAAGSDHHLVVSELAWN